MTPFPNGKAGFSRTLWGDRINPMCMLTTYAARLSEAQSCNSETPSSPANQSSSELSSGSPVRISLYAFQKLTNHCIRNLPSIVGRPHGASRLLSGSIGCTRRLPLMVPMLSDNDEPHAGHKKTPSRAYCYVCLHCNLGSEWVSQYCPQMRLRV